MTFSCIKFKRKFKMKFSLANADTASYENNGPVKEPTSSSCASRSSSASSTKSSKSSSSNNELNTSTTGLCKSSSPTENMVGSYNFNSNQLDSVEFKKAKPLIMKPYKKCSIASQSPGKFNPKLNSSHEALFKPLSKTTNKNIISKQSEPKCSSPKSMPVTPPLAPPPPPPPPLPPQSPIPPAIPSLASLPSLPASLIASNNLTFSSSNSGTLSTNVPSKSSFSNSSSSDKLSSNSKQFASKITSNQICKMERLAKMKSDLNPNKNNSTNSNSCSTANNKKTSNMNRDNKKINTKSLVYDHINISNKLKEHLYSPLNFENSRTVKETGTNGRESKISTSSSLSKKRKETRKLKNELVHEKKGLAIADSFDLIEKKLANSGMTMKKTKVIRKSEKRRSKLVFTDDHQCSNGQTVPQIDSKEILEVITPNTSNLKSELNENKSEEYSYALSHKSITTKSADKWDYNENEYDSNRDDENDQDADNEYEEDYIYDEEEDENEYEDDDNDDDDDDVEEDDQDEEEEGDEEEYDDCEKNCDCSKSNYGEEYEYEYNYEEEQNQTNKIDERDESNDKLKCAPEIENEYDVVDVDENFDGKQSSEKTMNSIEIARDTITPMTDTSKDLDQTTRLDVQEELDKTISNEKNHQLNEKEGEQLDLNENKEIIQENEEKDSAKAQSSQEAKTEELYEAHLNEKSYSIVSNSNHTNLESSITCTSF